VEALRAVLFAAWLACGACALFGKAACRPCRTAGTFRDGTFAPTGAGVSGYQDWKDLNVTPEVFIELDLRGAEVR
jgi:hypothetical protein